MLLSKRPELYLPDLWPSYFSKAKETYVWDMENKKYTDILKYNTFINTYILIHVYYFELYQHLFLQLLSENL